MDAGASFPFFLPAAAGDGAPGGARRFARPPLAEPCDRPRRRLVRPPPPLVGGGASRRSTSRSRANPRSAIARVGLSSARLPIRFVAGRHRWLPFAKQGPSRIQDYIQD